jgi:hypothetical protein
MSSYDETVEIIRSGVMLTQIHDALSHMALWAIRPKGFLLIWITMTVTAAMWMVWAVRPTSIPKSQRTTEGSIQLSLPRRVGTRGASAAVMLLAIFLAFYIAMTLLWEDFADYDNALFTLWTLVGHNYPPPIWPEYGRFFPLGFQEFNLIRHFSDTIIGYHLLPIAQLLVFSCILLVVDDELTVATRATLVILILLTPSIWISFNVLVLQERNVLFFLACLTLSVRRFEQTKFITWAVAATISAQAMLYNKETAFLLLLGFAAARLLLRCWNPQNARWEYDRLWDKETSLDLCLAALAMLFLLYYFIVMGFHNTRYADELRKPTAEILLAYLKVDLLAWLCVAVLLSRIYMILRRSAAPALLWDGLAVGGVVYFFAYHYLGIFRPYYLAPVDLVAVLYVGRFTILSWEKMRSWSKTAASVLALTVLLQDASLSAGATFSRKNAINGKAEIARVVEAQNRNHTGSALRLFFPFATPNVIAQFGAYLNYKGVPVEGVVGKSTELNNVVLATRNITKDGLCSYGTIHCHAISGPSPGDLVVVLPDDEASSVETSVYLGRGERLFAYEPRPPIPQWLHSLILPITWFGDVNKTLPDRWMHGSVTVWK